MKLFTLSENRLKCFICILGYFKYIVLNVYRLVVARAAVSALRSLTEEKRSLAIVNGPLAPLLYMAYSNLRDSPFLRCELPAPFFIEETSVSSDFTCEVSKFSFLFIKIKRNQKRIFKYII